MSTFDELRMTIVLAGMTFRARCAVINLEAELLRLEIDDMLSNEDD